MPKPDPKRYCAIVFIGGGSSWCWGPTPEKAANAAAKQCKQDWGRLFKFERKQEFHVAVYDMAAHDGWYAISSTVRDNKTGEVIPVHSNVKVIA